MCYITQGSVPPLVFTHQLFSILHHIRCKLLVEPSKEYDLSIKSNDNVKINLHEIKFKIEIKQCLYLRSNLVPTNILGILPNIVSLS